MSAAETKPAFELSFQKFQHSEFASDETQCFDAIIVINGKPSFHARNDGNGGCDHYTPLEYTDAGRKAMEDGLSAIKAHCATLPPMESHGQKLEFDTELFIATKVADELYKKDAAKLRAKLKARIICVEGGNLTMTKKLPANYLTAEGLANFQKRYPTATVVNSLSREEQDAIFAKAVRNQPLA